MNRIQRVRRFRLATLALSLGALLTVSSLPAAAPALAASGDTLKITPSAITAGANGSTFVARVSSNTVTPMKGIQASVTFDNTILEVVSIARVAGYWGSATVPIDGSDVATSNINGKVATWAASYLTSGGSPTGDVPFLDITFRVKACPVGGAAGTIGLPVSPAGGGADGEFSRASDGALVQVLPADAFAATVNCSPPAPNDFNLTSSAATVTISQGGTGATNVTATYVSGTPEVVTLSASGVPADVTATFGSTTVTPTAGTSLTFNAGATAVVGSYPIVVTGTSASTSKDVTVTLVITPPPAGPPPATGTTTVSGVVEAGFLGLSVDPNTALRLRRNAPNETSIPVLVYSNTPWTLAIEDAMLSGKAGTDRGHMLDAAASPQKRLSEAMQAYVPVAAPDMPLVRTLDITGPQSLTAGTLNQTVGVTISQLTKPIDPPGNYSIDLLFSAISGF